MAERFLRIFKSMDVKEVQKHLLIFGDLSGQCANCQSMEVKLDVDKCPKCQTEFKYIAFRNIKNHLPKMQEIKKQRPSITLVDHDDYKRTVGTLKAEEFLK
ncbi:MAG: hypothetical protein KAR05_09075 [Candidatus Omnitrophica bacterium]|nr:hypothetical protein [Candidatus Omnitrophota bacterium]